MEYNRGKILLSEDEDGNPQDAYNELVYEDVTYALRYINPAIKGSKGGNSSVFILFDPNSHEEKVIKISNYYRVCGRERVKENHRKRLGRFVREIEVLKKLQADTYLSDYVVDLFGDGEANISGREFPYYIMEKADDDLKNYILSDKEELDDQGRIKLCNDLLFAVEKLHYHGYYHRDIKPDNILVFKDSTGSGAPFRWKIGDLGLVSERNMDYDDLGERIGPFGWISPEAMNKYLTEKYNVGCDCKIDDKSDVFQLGQLFWFIFNKNTPLGIIDKREFNGSDDMFDIINAMSSHTKARRFNLNDVLDMIMPICRNYGVA